MSVHDRILALELGGRGLESPLADLPRELAGVVQHPDLPLLEVKIVKCRRVDEANPEALVDKPIVFDAARFLAGVRVELDQRELAELAESRRAIEAGVTVARAELAAARADVADLRLALDPEVRSRCSCCRRCGPTVPCMAAVRGESCEGACYCESR